MDIDTMEQYAKDKGVRIEYYTVSDLYEVLRPTGLEGSESCDPKYLGYDTYSGRDCSVVGSRYGNHEQ